MLCLQNKRQGQHPCDYRILVWIGFAFPEGIQRSEARALGANPNLGASILILGEVSCEVSGVNVTELTMHSFAFPDGRMLVVGTQRIGGLSVAEVLHTSLHSGTRNRAVDPWSSTARVLTCRAKGGRLGML